MPVDGGPEALSQDDALVTLGVGKNMVQSIRHWLLTMGMARWTGGAAGDGTRPRCLRTRRAGTRIWKTMRRCWLLHWQMTAPLSRP